MIFHYRVIWFVNGVQRVVNTHSAVAAEELLEMLSQLKDIRGGIDSVRVDAVPEEVCF